MDHRIITHARCIDGFCSAFILKKYLKFLLPEVKNIKNIYCLLPKDLQTKKFRTQKNDIILDLPSSTPAYAWFDHHRSNKPEIEKPNHFFAIRPSCTSWLLEIAEKNGLKITPELRKFWEVIDIIDDARYTEKQIKESYYPLNSYQNLTPLQSLHALGAMIKTKDHYLNTIMLQKLLDGDLPETPLDQKYIQKFLPEIFYAAQLESYSDWRKNVIMTYDQKIHTIIQDYTEQKVPGSPDRFYAYIKYPQSHYCIVLKPDLEQTRIGIGSNIFHKKRCKIDIGALCAEIGKKFGEGSGGGHFAVGGATIKIENTTKALNFIKHKIAASF